MSESKTGVESGSGNGGNGGSENTAFQKTTSRSIAGRGGIFGISHSFDAEGKQNGRTLPLILHYQYGLDKGSKK